MIDRPSTIDHRPSTARYYILLGLARDAPKKDIASAFRQKAKKWHPDKHRAAQAKADATQQMLKYREAYDVLEDKVLRWRYDSGEAVRSA